MTELQRVPIEPEIVEDGPEWEALVSEWADAGWRVFAGQLRQARAAAAVQRHYGMSSMEKFAQEVGVSKSTVYDYARVYNIYGHLYEDSSGRLESSGLLDITHLIECSYAPDPIKMLERAEDEGLSSRQIKAERQAESGSRNVQKAETRVCEACGGSGVVPVD
jgi:hypothetical protein